MSRDPAWMLAALLTAGKQAICAPPPAAKLYKDAGGKITDHRPGGEKANPNNCCWANEQTR
jgi:hypothetical protein